MKRRGVVRGQTIEISGPVDLPDGQRVEVDIRLAGAVEPQFEHIREADRIREGLEEFWGGKLNRSLGYIREDREALKPYAHRTS